MDWTAILAAEAESPRVRLAHERVASQEYDGMEALGAAFVERGRVPGDLLQPSPLARRRNRDRSTRRRVTCAEWFRGETAFGFASIRINR